MVYRLNSDGTKDTSFIVSNNIFNVDVYAIGIQSDGTVVAA
jgi:hypothetical protein